MDIVGILEKVGFDSRVFLFNLINFSIVAFILYKFVYKKINTVLEERQKVIQTGIENSTKSVDLLDSAQQEAEQILINARNNAKSIVEDSELNAGIRSEEIIHETESRVKDMLDTAEKKSEDILQQKIRNFNESSSEIVVKAAKKLIENQDSSV